MICSVCGCPYQPKDAKIEFNSYFMNSLEFDLDYETEFTEQICGSCAIDAVENGMQDSLKDDDREKNAEDELGFDEGYADGLDDIPPRASNDDYMAGWYEGNGDTDDDGY